MIVQEDNGCILRSVEPLKAYLLRICTMKNEEIVFDFTPLLCKTRFADLKNVDLFCSAVTDGRNIIFKKPGVMPLILSAGELLEMQKSRSIRPIDGEGEYVR